MRAPSHAGGRGLRDPPRLVTTAAAAGGRRAGVVGREGEVGGGAEGKAVGEVADPTAAEVAATAAAVTVRSAIHTQSEVALRVRMVAPHWSKTHGFSQKVSVE